MATEEKEPEVVEAEKEPEHKLRDTEPIPITIVRPTTKLVPNAEITKSLSRPQLTGPTLEVPIPQHTEIPSFTTPEAYRGKGIARDTSDSPVTLVKATREIRPDLNAPILID
ncbi:hypothetical protein Tco_0002169 [Tanacetum coccineum]